MLLEEFCKSERVEKVKELTDALRSLGFYGVFLELSQRQQPALDFKNGQASEKALYERGEVEGYRNAIFDLFYFYERIVSKIMQVGDDEQIKFDFGAVDSLLKQKIITEEEADAIRNGKA